MSPMRWMLYGLADAVTAGACILCVGLAIVAVAFVGLCAWGLLMAPDGATRAGAITNLLKWLRLHVHLRRRKTARVTP